MQGVTLLILTAAVVLVPASPDARKALEPFQGKWEVVSASERGKPADPKALKKFPVTFTGDVMEMVYENSRTIKWAVTVRPDQKPKEIDATLPKEVGKSGVLRGIYEFEGDTLTIAFGLDEASTRPQKFESTGGKMPTLLMVLKKAK